MNEKHCFYCGAETREDLCQACGHTRAEAVAALDELLFGEEHGESLDANWPGPDRTARDGGPV